MSNLSLKFLTEEEVPHAYIQLIDEMTKKDLAIFEAYCYFGELVLLGEHQDVSPARSTIADRARCSLSSVRNFIRKYEGLVFSHETRRRNDGSGLHDSNKYHLNIGCLEAYILLKYNNYFYRWKEKRLEVMHGMQDNSYFLVEKALKRDKLSTRKLPTAIMQKLPTIKSYIKFQSYNCTPEKRTHQSTSISKKNFGVFADIPLTYAQIKSLEYQNAMVDLEAARRDHHKYVFDWGKKVNSPYWFMQKQAERNYMKRAQRKSA